MSTMELKHEWVALNDRAGDSPLTDEERRFLIDGLYHENKQVWMSAVAVVSAADRVDVLEVLKIYKDLRMDVKKNLVPVLASMEFHEPYWLLCEDLKETKDEELERILVICLAKTDYSVFPINIHELQEASQGYLFRLKKVLSVMGWPKIKPVLELLPYVPHETVFRDVFGDDLINRLNSIHN